MGVAGSFLTLSAFNAFFFNMVNGRGWICVALVVFASWRPGKALLGALLFAFFDALQLRLQQSGGAALPYQVYLMLPYAAVDPGAGAGGAQGRLSAGADEALPQGRTLTHEGPDHARPPRHQRHAARRPHRHVDRRAGRPHRRSRAPASTAPAHETVDAGGLLVAPPFVDPHFHMDATLSYGLPRVNASGTLLEGIALWGELKPLLTPEALIERALAYCDWAVAQGPARDPHATSTSATRACSPSRRCCEVQARGSRPTSTCSWSPFRRTACCARPARVDNLKRALDMGVDVVGGIPHFERTMADGAASVQLLCEIAAERGLLVDMHCDETDDPLSRHIETLAFETQRLGLQGRVTGSHCTSMHSMDNYYVSQAAAADRRGAACSVIANPLINITLQGRHDTYPKRRGMTRVPELMAAGVNVAFGHDCVMDPWYGLGSRRHARGRAHGPARGADDQPGGDARSASTR